jgi:hypothetical protein
MTDERKTSQAYRCAAGLVRHYRREGHDREEAIEMAKEARGDGFVF